MKSLTCGIPPALHLQSNSDLLIISDRLCLLVLTFCLYRLSEYRLRSYIRTTLYLSGMISVCLLISQSVSHDVKLWCA